VLQYVETHFTSCEKWKFMSICVARQMVTFCAAQRLRRVGKTSQRLFADETRFQNWRNGDVAQLQQCDVSAAKRTRLQSLTAYAVEAVFNRG
jgi:hypothetical protein